MISRAISITAAIGCVLVTLGLGVYFGPIGFLTGLAICWMAKSLIVEMW